MMTDTFGGSMKALNLGIIGYGNRIKDVLKAMQPFGIPFKVAAVADPRASQIKASNDPLLAADTAYFETADAMLAGAKLDGVMIGTRCNLHTEMACKVATLNLPLFLEKPVSISYEQVAQLEAAFAQSKAPVVVSFPLRLSPIALKAKAIIDSGQLGPVEHVVAFNDVPYGEAYFAFGYRDYEITGGLWLQKATHDLDTVNFLLGQRPKTVCAMMSQRVYGGDKPMDLLCRDCDENESCRESPFNLFYQRGEGQGVKFDEWRHCVYGREIKNEDSGNCIIEYENGVQAAYSQNFFIKNKAARRGARFYGEMGTLEFDWYTNTIKVFSHTLPTVESIDFSGGAHHFGGDSELCRDFLLAMRDGQPSRSPLDAGLVSALTCLAARESCETRKFVDVRATAAIR
jgi:predicted dehydrogenase